MMITATATPAPIAALRSETNYKRMERSNRQQIIYFLRYTLFSSG